MQSLETGRSTPTRFTNRARRSLGEILSLTAIFTIFHYPQISEAWTSGLMSMPDSIPNRRNSWRTTYGRFRFDLVEFAGRSNDLELIADPEFPYCGACQH